MREKILKKNKRGFTLIEMLVAVAILVASTAGPMVVASQGAQLGRHSKDQLIASYLAQDAIEYVRYAIATQSNNDVSQGSVINTNYINRCIGTNVCQIDTTLDYDDPSAISICSGGNCADLQWDPSNGIYNYTGASSTSFNREIQVRDTGNGPGSSDTVLPNDTEYTITVKVWWNNKTQSLEITNRIVDWRVVF